MRFSLFKYGTGVLYGIATDIYTVDPETGPSPGGNAFSMSGIGFDPRHWDDLFTAAVLDPIKWLDLTAGSGTLTVASPNLTLSSGAVAGSIAGVETVSTWTNVQGEIRCTIPRYTTYPATEVVCVALQLYVDANNYCRLSIRCGSAASSLYLYAEVYKGGALIEEYETAWTSGTSMLKILRWNSDVYFIANSNIVHHTRDFNATLATLRLYVDNQAAAYDVYNTQLEWFYYRPFAVFENQPIHDTVIVSDSRLRGVVPPSIDGIYKEAAYAGLVDTSVVGNGSFTLADSYEYYYIDGLTVIDSLQQETKISLINDEQVVTPDGYVKGLGGGY